MHTVLQSSHVAPDYLSPLDGIASIRLPEEGSYSREELLRIGKSEPIHGMIVPGERAIDNELLDAFPQLKVVANTAVGFDNLPLEELTRRGIQATNTPESFVHATADATFALLLSVARKVATGDRYVRSGEWPNATGRSSFWEGMELRGKTLGIVGFGRIGEEVAKRATAFGMKILFHRRNQKWDARWRSLDELLASSDVISLHTPLTPATRHLIDAPALAKMRRGAILVNMARGPVVDEAALVETLKAGHLSGAGLDVFENEPVVHPDLPGMDQVTLTPHVGGATVEGRRHAHQTAAENVAHVLRGEHPLHPLNKLE